MKEVKDYSPKKDPRLIDCKTECGNDKCYAKRYGLFAEKTCQNFVKAKLQTNADRIRSMTYEELADYMHRIIANVAGNPEICPSISFLEYWLEQEAEEDE